jgi:hypothetical protein
MQKVSRDPDFVAKVRDSVALYLNNPPEPSSGRRNNDELCDGAFCQP